MAERRLGLIMHGVTGRMGYNQHLVRSILAIRDQGGVVLKNGDRLMPDPIIVGRDREKIQRLAEKHHIAALDHRPRRGARPTPTTRSSSMPARRRCAPSCSAEAIDAGKHVYCEKPVSDDLEVAVALAKKAKAAGDQARRGAGQAVPARAC